MTKVTVANADLWTDSAALHPQLLTGEFMSKVTVGDLPKANELSPSDMAKATGGADSEAAIQIWANFHATADALAEMGFTEGAANLQNGGNSALFKNSP
jgi:hypothetical protein